MAAFSSSSFNTSAFSEAAFDFSSVSPDTPVVQVAGGAGYNYKPRKKRDIIKEVMDEIKEAVDKETAIPEAEINRLSPLFDRPRFYEIQQQIAIINQRIEEQRLYDQLSQERADLRKLIFIIENSLKQEMRLMQEDEELLLVLNL
jgi:hypothetical protein